MICGYFARENQAEVIAQARRPVEFSANLFQQKLIDGFSDVECDFSVLSAPFIGAFPNASSRFAFRGFQQSVEGLDYVRFNNVWGWRNISRAAALKRAVKDFVRKDASQKLILVYSAHTPFLKAAIHAKKQDPRIRVCLMVPDLPEYMNLSTHRGLLYDVAKKYDIASMTKLMAQVDSFVVLTEQMKERLPVGDKPCQVVEGIVSQIPQPVSAENRQEKYVVYTGKLDAAFGVKALVDAMSLIQDPDLRLVLCGQGDSYDYAVQASGKDSRIRPMGQVSPETAAQWQRKAAVLINPRGNVGEYTKYSFPSKNVEYLLSGKPVAAYQLHGMPQCYREFLYLIDDDKPAVEAIQDALEQAVSDDPSHKEEKYRSFIRYAEQNLRAKRIAERIMELTF